MGGERLLASDKHHARAHVGDHISGSKAHVTLLRVQTKVLFDDGLGRRHRYLDRLLQQRLHHLAHRLVQRRYDKALEAGLSVQQWHVRTNIYQVGVVGQRLDLDVAELVLGRLGHIAGRLALGGLRLGRRHHRLGRLALSLGQLLVHNLERAQQALHLHLLDFDVQIFAQHLDLELVIELEIGLVVQLDQHTDDRVEPRIGRLEHLALAGRLEHLGHERHHEQQLGRALLERLHNQRLEVDVFVQDGPIARQCYQTEPRAQVLEQRSVRKLLVVFVAAQQHFDIAERLRQNALVQRFLFERVDKLGVQNVKVGFNGDPFDDQIVGHPLPVLVLVQVLELFAFGLHVRQRQVVEYESDFVLDLFGRRRRLGMRVGLVGHQKSFDVGGVGNGGLGVGSARLRQSGRCLLAAQEFVLVDGQLGRRVIGRHGAARAVLDVVAQGPRYVPKVGALRQHLTKAVQIFEAAAAPVQHFEHEEKRFAGAVRLAHHLDEHFETIVEHGLVEYVALDHSAPHTRQNVELHLVQLVHVYVQVDQDVLESVGVKVLVLFFLRVLELGQQVDKVVHAQTGQASARLEQTLDAFVHFFLDFLGIEMVGLLSGHVELRRVQTRPDRVGARVVDVAVLVVKQRGDHVELVVVEAGRRLVH
ncbi:hypothetical protein BpHYR1_020999 [Brachionus plicatilis]|uniref:Uncharacterized protein n=1 Tax=Brachionus plicatilis TaxID=10195 RepID=A0A3M7RLE3_BRAPC|nr:hypothetical protein BpHYR1_020999 [Brachionus plicatilis]